jgi:hypothetical protein
MSDESNVVAFAPRPIAPPPFSHAEFRLRRDCTLQVNAVDERGDIVIFEFGLIAPVTAADLTRLVGAWATWRGTSAPAA